jgi:hypothetical protein
MESVRAFFIDLRLKFPNFEAQTSYHEFPTHRRASSRTAGSP